MEAEGVCIRKMKKLIFAVVLFLAIHTILFIGATARVPDNGLRDFIAGNYAHFIAFFCVAASASLILLHERIRARFPLIISFLYSSFLTFIVELVQKLIGYRTFSEKDILIGVLGAVTYTIFAAILLRFKIGLRFFNIFTKIKK
ncbi:MAG: VanZ family protein [Nanoarchaeota archaeon]|nr:VanZ family protein [Nanoarchaeota archaeon]